MSNTPTHITFSLSPDAAATFQYTAEDIQTITDQLITNQNTKHPRYQLAVHYSGGFTSYPTLVCTGECGSCSECADREPHMIDYPFMHCFSDHIETLEVTDAETLRTYGDTPEKRWESIRKEADDWFSGKENGFKEKWAKTIKTQDEMYWFDVKCRRKSADAIQWYD